MAQSVKVERLPWPCLQSWYPMSTTRIFLRKDVKITLLLSIFVCSNGNNRQSSIHGSLSVPSFGFLIHWRTLYLGDKSRKIRHLVYRSQGWYRSEEYFLVQSHKIPLCAPSSLKSATVLSCKALVAGTRCEHYLQRPVTACTLQRIDWYRRSSHFQISFSYWLMLSENLLESEHI